MAFPQVQPMNPLETVRTFMGLQAQQEQIRARRAQEARAQQAAALQQQKNELQRQTQDALSQALGDDPDMSAFGKQRLMELNPEIAMKVDLFERNKSQQQQQFQSGQIQQQRGMAQLEREEIETRQLLEQQEIGQLNKQRNILGAIRALPFKERPLEIKRLGEKKLDVSGFEGVDLSDGEMDKALELIDQELLARRGPEVFDPESGQGKIELDLANSIKTGMHPDSVARIGQQAKNMAAGKSGITINNYPQGKQDLTKATRNMVQKRLVEQTAILTDVMTLERFSESIHSHLTAWGRVKGMAFEGMDYLDILSFLDDGEKTQFLAERQELFGHADQVFNSMRRYITGAAAPEAELKRLEQTFPNRKMSPTVFEAAVKTLRDATMRAYRMNQFVLESGFSGSKEEFEQRLSGLWSLGERGTKSQRFVESRVRQLVPQLSKELGPDEDVMENVMKKLYQEQYFASPGEARRLDWDKINRIAQEALPQ